ncbi:hypothetical protein ACU61A_14645 [Pseudonocardia sichuanensis]
MTRSGLAAMSVVAVTMLSVAGCGTDEVVGSPNSSDVAPQAQPAGPTAQVPAGAPGGRYAYVDGLCRQIDFSTVEEILPFSGEMDQSGHHSRPYSVAKCFSENAPRDETIAAGSTRVEAQWLPTPRLAAAEYENKLPVFSGDATGLIELPGRWERATLANGNGVSTTAASLLVHDSNLVIEVELAFSMVEAENQAATAVQRVAESIFALSGDR